MPGRPLRRGVPQLHAAGWSAAANLACGASGACALSSLSRMHARLVHYGGSVLGYACGPRNAPTIHVLLSRGNLRRTPAHPP